MYLVVTAGCSACCPEETSRSERSSPGRNRSRRRRRGRLERDRRGRVADARRVVDIVVPRSAPPSAPRMDSLSAREVRKKARRAGRPRRPARRAGRAPLPATRVNPGSPRATAVGRRPRARSSAPGRSAAAHVGEPTNVERGHVEPLRSRRTMHRWTPSMVTSRSPVVPSAQPSHTPRVRFARRRALVAVAPDDLRHLKVVCGLTCRSRKERPYRTLYAKTEHG